MRRTVFDVRRPAVVDDVFFLLLSRLAEDLVRARAWDKSGRQGGYWIFSARHSGGRDGDSESSESGTHLIQTHGVDSIEKLRLFNLTRAE